MTSIDIYTCEICDSKHENAAKLSRHIRDKHNIQSDVYYKAYVENVGCCLLCGNDTSYVDIRNGFRKFCTLSCSRKYNVSILKNDPKLYNDFSEKMSSIVKEMWATTDQSERVKKSTDSRRISISRMTNEERKEMFGWMNKLPAGIREAKINEILDVSLFAWRRNATQEQKNAVYQKNTKTWELRTEEERRVIREKKQLAWRSKTDSEMLEIVQKIMTPKMTPGQEPTFTDYSMQMMFERLSVVFDMDPQHISEDS